MYRQTGHAANAICTLCNGRVQSSIYMACGHVFCWNCISEYQNVPGLFRNHCPECYNNQCLQLVSVDRNGQLYLQESVLRRCFLEYKDCKDYPSYVISVVGERHSGKSFLMNYLMRALRSLEMKSGWNLGKEKDPLNGFPWGYNPDKATQGIWIWSRPFILNNDGKKMAVYLLDTKGTTNPPSYPGVSAKLSVLTMLISSHLVYNLNSSMKKTDIDYLEIYCNPAKNNTENNVENKQFFELKFFDVLIRDWKNPERCGSAAGKSHIIEKIQEAQGDRDRVLAALQKGTVRCVLMPHPSHAIAGGGSGCLDDMDLDFQRSLNTYLSTVVSRAKVHAPFDEFSCTMTCSQMATKIKMCVDYLQRIGNCSRPSELCDKLSVQVNKGTDEKMESIIIRFKDFLQNQPLLILPSHLKDKIQKNVSECLEEYEECLLLSRYELRINKSEKLLCRLLHEGEMFCEEKKKNLKDKGYTVFTFAVKTAVTAVACQLLMPVAAPAAAAGWSAGWFTGWFPGWFAAAPAAPATYARVAIGAVGTAAAAVQAGAGYLLRLGRLW
ncbi:RING finger protein 112-like [Hyperolius riggenbachi]|uniref:RING finger protein 112-like n=1 Tax=Hyperolius riggenbachi TaxID=752182 RepID=UPI0035A2B92D